MAAGRRKNGDRSAQASVAVFVLRLFLAVLLYLAYELWFDLIPFADPSVPDSVWTVLDRIIGLLAFGAGAMALTYGLRHFFWHGWVESRTDTQVPKLLIDISSFAVWVAALVTALSVVFDVSVSAFLTTSGIVIAVIGFALRYLISDVFTGIALGLERPFNIGDWIELEDGTLGKVVEINWRATKLVTKQETAVVVPNTFLATRPFTNFNWPEDYFRNSFEIVLEYDVTSHQAERILLAAVNQATGDLNIPRKPDLRIREYTPRGIKWEVRFWCPEHQDLEGLQYKVRRYVLRNLHFAGVRVPREKLELLSSTHPKAIINPVRRDVNFLRDVHLFDSMSDDELEQLRNRMDERLCLRGDPIVQQGDEGNSLFLLREGYLDVFIDNEDGNRVMVGHLLPGTFFGEMSLLTGAKRAATVIPSVDADVFEISKDHIRPFIEESADLARQLSLALAERQVQNDRALSQAPKEQIEIQKRTTADRLFSKIQSYFDLIH